MHLLCMAILIHAELPGDTVAAARRAVPKPNAEIQYARSPAGAVSNIVTIAHRAVGLGPLDERIFQEQGHHALHILPGIAVKSHEGQVGIRRVLAIVGKMIFGKQRVKISIVSRLATDQALILRANLNRI